MNTDLLMVVGLLAAAIILFVNKWLRMDVVALLIIIAFPLTGVLTIDEALSGFSDPNVILIAALFVIGEGLVRTGVAYQVGDWLATKAGQSETRLLVLLMLVVAGLGSVMSSTGVVAIFIPVVLSVAARMKLPASRLMMPLSFAGLISGMMTLVATPPNMVVNSELARQGMSGFGFFSFTPIGLIVLILGIAYMLFARRWLRSGEEADNAANQGRRTLQDLIDDYHLAGRAHRFRIQPDSPLIGHTLGELHFRARLRANVVGLERVRKLHSEVVKVSRHTELRAGDILLVDVFEQVPNIDEELHQLGLVRLPLHGRYFTEQSREVGMAEIMLPPESNLVDRSILELEFRSKYGLNVVGLRRNQKALTQDINKEKLQMGDVLLVIGAWKAIRRLQSQTRDFLVLSLPAEIDAVAPVLNKAPHALLSLLVMIGLMVSGFVPNVVAALIGCLLMGLFRCIDMTSAYRSIHWQSLILIIGMLPFALALEKTGGIDLTVTLLVDALGDAGPHVLLASLFLITAAIGLFISNTATAVLMAPIAFTMAKQIGVSPYPFVMMVAIAASAAFMTPISSPVNTLVLEPGHYRFSDFVRIGVPFTLMIMVVCVIVVPLLFPMQP